MGRLVGIVSLCCWYSLFASGVTSSPAADVEVRLKDGRTLNGSVLEMRTNDEQLTLEQRSSGIAIRRTLTWNQVADIRVVPPQKNLVRAVGPTKTIEPLLDRQLVEPLPLSQLLVKADPISTTGKRDWDSLRLTLRGVDKQGDSVPVFGTLKVTLWGQQRVRPESRIVRYPIVSDANFGSRYLCAPSNAYSYQHPFVTSPNPTIEMASWTQAIATPVH